MSQFNRKQLQALNRFVEGKVSLEELIIALEDIAEIDFSDQGRQLIWHFGIRKPEVRVKLNHIHHAMNRHSRGEITTEQLADWAGMLLLNDAYGWEGQDQEEITELLNDISFLTIEPQPPMED
jgi:hypothetical protein